MFSFYSILATLFIIFLIISFIYVSIYNKIGLAIYSYIFYYLVFFSILFYSTLAYAYNTLYSLAAYSVIGVILLYLLTCFLWPAYILKYKFNNNKTFPFFLFSTLLLSASFIPLKSAFYVIAKVFG